MKAKDEELLKKLLELDNSLESQSFSNLNDNIAS